MEAVDLVLLTEVEINQFSTLWLFKGFKGICNLLQSVRCLDFRNELIKRIKDGHGPLEACKKNKLKKIVFNAYPLSEQSRIRDLLRH